MRGRNALKLIYFASLVISSILPRSFLVRWFSMIMLSGTLITLFVMRVNKASSALSDPRIFYDFKPEIRTGTLSRTKDIIRRASLGHSFAKEMIAERVLDILAYNISTASKNEIRRDPGKYITTGPLLDLLSEEEESEGDEYLNLLDSALKQADLKGD